MLSANSTYRTRIDLRYSGRNPFISTTSEDIEWYRHLSLPGAPKPPSLALPSPNLWRRPRSGVTHMELLSYFRDAAHYSLATFNPTTSHIRDVIMHMIFTRDTVSRRALFYALLAFSSLHRSGLHRDTMLLKVAALKALSASAKEAAQGAAEAAQHVAACMILCAFEILLPSESSGEWLWYIRGAMEIVERAQLGDRIDFTGSDMLLDWVYYHHSLSRFTLYHWRHKNLALEVADTALSSANQIAQGSPLAAGKMKSQYQSPPHTVLNILSEACEVLLDPSDPKSQESEYQDRLRALRWKVDNLPPLSTSTPTLGDLSDDMEITAQLYQVATRIYLARVSHDPLGASEDLDALIDSTFSGPVQACYCRHFFPLLIISCEARTDEQRAAILNLIDRTEKSGYTRPMKTFRGQVQSFWIQQDLYADEDLVPTYLNLMKAAISSNKALPSYA
ncbi:hypothetical protein ANO14919_104660 [Xylariales sp. No.14919]|nr:hypothetical protein ANO14919_104660 [Xylariales sp. No.14919]